MQIPKNGIKVSDKEAIKTVVKAVNGRASLHTIGYNGVIGLADTAEELLIEKGIAPSGRTGCEFIYEGAGPSAKSYKYSVVASFARLRRYSEGWRLVEFDRSYCGPGYKGRHDICLKPDQVELIKRKALAAVMDGVQSLSPKKKQSAA